MMTYKLDKNFSSPALSGSKNKKKIQRFGTIHLLILVIYQSVSFNFYYCYILRLT